MLTLEHLAELLSANREAARVPVREFSLRGQLFDFNRRRFIMGVINLSSESWYKKAFAFRLSKRSGAEQCCKRRAHRSSISELNPRSCMRRVWMRPCNDHFCYPS